MNINNYYFGKDAIDEASSKLKLTLEDSKKILIVKDKNVSNIYFKKIIKQLDGFSIYYYEFEAIEENKSLEEFSNIVNLMNDALFERNDCIIAIGGGITCDLVGYVASSYKRGCKHIFFPTTTLSMIDASIGGKCGINLNNCKNIIGAFYEPKLVISDLSALDSLDKRNFNNGLVEAIKMGLTLNKELWDLFKSEDFDIEKIISLSIKTKLDVVNMDKYDNLGKRIILNFGHTIAHAIELSSKYLHGECVALGIYLNTKSESLKEEIKELFNRLDIDVLKIKQETFNTNMFEIIKHDKKANNSYIEEIELNELEKYKIFKVDFEDIETYYK